MTRYFFVILIMALIGVAIVVKAGVTMFAERQYWQDGEKSFFGEIKERFGDSLYTVGRDMRGFVIVVLGSLPILIAWAVIIVIAVLIVKKIRKGRKKKKEGSGTPGFHPQCQYGFHLYRTSQDIPGQECSPIQSTPQERTPGKKP